MKLRGHTLGVLIKKDIKVLFTNKNILIMIFLPVIFALLYQMIYGDMAKNDVMHASFVLCISELVNMVAIPLTGLGMMIAEEKEKHTLRVLMLSDVSASEYLASKVIVNLIVMECIGIIIFFVTAAPFHALPLYLLVTTLTALAILLFGAVIGIASKDQMSTSTWATPLMFLFLLPPMLGEFNNFMASIAKFVPTFALNEMIKAIIDGQSIFTSAMLSNFVLIGVWIILGAASFVFMYKKKRFDN